MYSTFPTALAAQGHQVQPRHFRREGLFLAVGVLTPLQFGFGYAGMFLDLHAWILQQSAKVRKQRDTQI